MTRMPVAQQLRVLAPWWPICGEAADLIETRMETLHELVCDANLTALIQALEDQHVEPDKIVAVMLQELPRGIGVGSVSKYRVLYRVPKVREGR
jgi:hypothetical protein